MLAIRERALTSGVLDLGDAELVTLLLGTGSIGHSVERVALALLEAAGGLEGIARLGPHAFATQPGVGPVKAARLAAALELGRRVLIRTLSEHRPVIDCFEAAADWARPRLAALEHEEVWLLCLDGCGGLKASTRIAQGGLHGCALTARDVLAPAVKNGAAAILLIHNHPSGDPQPSPDDVEMTKHVARCADLIGIPLLDHVVVARSGARSIMDPGAARGARRAARSAQAGPSPDQALPNGQSGSRLAERRETERRETERREPERREPERREPEKP